MRIFLSSTPCPDAKNLCAAEDKVHEEDALPQIVQPSAAARSSIKT